MRRLQLHAEPPGLAVEEAADGPLDPSPRCQRCPLSNGAATVCMPADVELRADPGVEGQATPGRDGRPVLLVVGDTPARPDEREARPFFGPSGQKLRKLLAGLWEGDVVYTLAVRCHPGATRVHPSYVAQCRAHLLGDIRRYRPTRVLVMGALAAQAVVGEAMAQLSSRGCYGFLRDGTPVFHVLHPGITHDNRFLDRWFREDLEQACRRQVQQPGPVAVNVVENEEDAREAAAHLEDSFGRVSFDFETFGQMGDDDFRAITLALSVGEEAWVWDEDELGELREAPEVAEATRLLGDPSVEKVAQNAKFDINAAWFGLGAQVRGEVKCSRLIRKLLDADADAKLSTMAHLVGRGGWKDEATRQRDLFAAKIRKLAVPSAPATLQVEGHVAGGADLEVAVRRVLQGRSLLAYAYVGIERDVRERYCAGDAVTAGHLVEALWPKVKADPGLAQLWTDVVHPMQRAVAMMERNGNAFDKAAAKRLRLHLQDQVDDAIAVMALYGLREPGSTQSAAKVLYDDLKLACTKKTLKGQRSTDREALEDAVPSTETLRLDPSLDPMKPHPCAQALLEWRTAQSWLTRYADGMELYVRDDGRIHPNILMDGTDTGRPSCSDPNMFNLPRPKTFEGKLVRDMVTAQPGWVLLEVDQSQIEIRKAAELSGDRKMKELLESGQDFHQATARLIAPYLKDPSGQPYRVADITKDHVLRDWAKTINFAVLYGTPASGLAHQLGIPVPQAQAIVDAIFGQFVDLKRWIDQMLQQTRLHGYTRTFWRGLAARRRDLVWVAAPDSDERKKTAERGAWNTPVQGSAADVTNATCGLVQAWLDREDPGGLFARLVLTVYDSVVLEVRADALDRVRAKVVELSEGHESGVRLVAEPKHGVAWGSLKT